jgi:membrane-associated phospholipid phosphatase
VAPVQAWGQGRGVTDDLDDTQVRLPGTDRSAALAPLLVLASILFAGVILLIGELTVPGRLWWASDQERSKQVFDAGLHHDALATLADWIGHLTVPTVLRVVTVVCAVLLWRRGLRAVALWWVATMLISGGVAIGLRYLVARQRPHWPGSGPLVEGYTFPSGHATSAAVFAGCVVIVTWPYLGRIGRAATTLAAVVFFVAVGGSRLVLGVHRISDVLAAWALAAALLLAMLAVAAEPRVRRRLSPAPAEPAARAAEAAPRPGLRGS